MTTGPVHLHLVMSGGASLGAFHGGALAAILTALRKPARAGLVRIDAIGGTSAGAIAALIASYAWLEGVDPVWLLREAWVDRVSTELLRTRTEAAPLSFERLRDDIVEWLDPESDELADHRVDAAPTPLALHANLLNLHGLTYDIPVDGAAAGASYDDWIQHVLHPGGGLTQMIEPDGCSPLDSVLASAAHPAAFAPMWMDRSRDAAEMRRNGVRGLPDNPGFWYADGGPMANNPVARVLQAGDRVRDGRPDRLHALVIDPRSQGPTDGTFAGEDRPSWLGGLKRTTELLPSQAIYDDLRRIGTINERLARIGEVATELPEDAAAQLRDVLLRVLSAEDDTDADLGELLRDLAGARHKVAVTCDLIAPNSDTDVDADASERLSGDVLGDFGGFLHRRLRRDDFALGYRCALNTLEDRADWLRERADDQATEDVDAGLEDARAAAPDPGREPQGSRLSLPLVADSAASFASIGGSAAMSVLRRVLPW